MQLLPIFCTATLFALASARAAPKNRDSPAGVVYAANFVTSMIGTMVFYSSDGYVKVFVDIYGFRSTEGPFTYQIHEHVVPPDGDCYAASGTFDPYDGTPNAPTWALAKVGDLSGKHGPLTGPDFHKIYFDPYLSLNPSNEAFFGRLSVVIRDRNGKRIDCTNIYKADMDALKLDDLQKNGSQEPPQVDAEKSVDVDVDVNKQVDVDKKHGVDVDKKVNKSKRSNVDVDSGVDVDVDKQVDSGVDVDVDRRLDADLPFSVGRVRL